MVCTGLLLGSSISFAQKVKYKDLYVLLRVENYDDADKFLRLYLTQEPEDPHANYSMGRMLQAYLDQGNLLNGSERMQQLADSSKFYYTKALNLTTEKYVKKNDDDYYLDFRRRDMRTGKFEVKFSDVQYDIEERIVAVDKFESDLNSMLNHFKLAQDYYANCQNWFKNLTEKSATLNHLYFTSSVDDVNAMREVIKVYDSSLYHLNTYRSIMKDMGKSAVNQDFKQKEIDSYPEGGFADVEFYAETIEYLDYKSWANKHIDIILRQIYPLKKRLITFDKRVKDLHDEVVIDSLDRRDEVFRLATENVGRDLRDYDPNSLPAAIFNYRIAEINYHSAVYYWLREVADSVDIDVKMDMLYDFTSQISGVSKLVYRMHDANTPAQLELYEEYVSARYESPEGMTRFIKDHEDEVRDDSLQLVQWIEELQELDKVAIWQEDSIMLTEGEVRLSPEKSFTTIIVDTLATRTLGFYSWKKSTDSLTLSFGVAPSNRKLDTLFNIPINTAVVDQTLPIPEYLVDTVGLGKRIWLLQASEMSADSTYLTQVFITDYTVGSAWIREIPVPNHVTMIKRDLESDNLVILGEGDESLAVLDKYGELVVEDEPPEEEKEEEGENEEGDPDGEGGGGPGL